MGRNKNKQRHIQAEIVEQEPVETAATVEGATVAIVDLEVIPVPKRYTPPNCSACTALRSKPETSYVTVASTQRIDGYVFRYCKCSFCGNTFKDSEKA